MIVHAAFNYNRLSTTMKYSPERVPIVALEWMLEEARTNAARVNMRNDNDDN
jgi:hypothetical protein